MRCRICDNEKGNTAYPVREVRSGSKETFTYVCCAACGCIQIAEEPKDIASYYDTENYYSFSQPKGLKKFLIDTFGLPVVRYYTKGAWGAFALGKINAANPLFRPFAWRWGLPDVRQFMDDFGTRYDDVRSARILDVGCGYGKLLGLLAKGGFTNLSGVDPFITDTVEGDGYRVEKKTIFDVATHYDIIIFSHSIEHMFDNHAVMRQAMRLVRTGGHIWIRVPIVSDYFLANYGETWAMYDAPRHFYLHTRESIRALVRPYGGEVLNVTLTPNLSSLLASEVFTAGKDFSKGQGAGYAYFLSHFFEIMGKQAKIAKEGLADAGNFVIQKK